MSRKTEVFLFYGCAFFPLDDEGESCLNKQFCGKMAKKQFPFEKAKFFRTGKNKDTQCCTIFIG
ncbi:MAG: hypothetical protein D3925_12965 [Candidatus Electrothrix sp. AR5]|nr:hypothetical protein [Candidatus Electrothrix sp. AR5]